jgi:uncharacterized protein (TIGR00251 family)
MTNLPQRKTPDGIVIEVRLQPRASRSRIAGLHGSALKVCVTAPPVEGEANRALVELLRGGASRNKTVLVRGVDGLEIE